jgi:hypothetical protein
LNGIFWIAAGVFPKAGFELKSLSIGKVSRRQVGAAKHDCKQGAVVHEERPLVAEALSKPCPRTSYSEQDRFQAQG